MTAPNPSGFEARVREILIKSHCRCCDLGRASENLELETVAILQAHNAEKEREVRGLVDTLRNIIRQPQEIMSNGKSLRWIIELAKKALAPYESKKEGA